MNELMNKAFSACDDIKGYGRSCAGSTESKSALQKIADENARMLGAPPAGLHLPTAEELELMEQWIIAYKKQNPNASKREVRKEAQDQFKVKIFRKPFKREKCNTLN